MSGPIVRKYGFPNFEQIFGKRELEHGVDDVSTPAESPESERAPADSPTDQPKKKPSKKKK